MEMIGCQISLKTALAGESDAISALSHLFKASSRIQPARVLATMAGHMFLHSRMGACFAQRELEEFHMGIYRFWVKGEQVGGQLGIA